MILLSGARKIQISTFLSQGGTFCGQVTYSSVYSYLNFLVSHNFYQISGSYNVLYIVQCVQHYNMKRFAV